MLIIRKDVKKSIDSSVDKVSKFYDVETLTEDKVNNELKMLYSKYEQLNEVLAMMERVKGQHPDVMDFYEERDIIGNKIIALENYYSYRRNFFIKAVLKKKGAGTVRYTNFDDWEVK